MLRQCMLPVIKLRFSVRVAGERVADQVRLLERLLGGELAGAKIAVRSAGGVGGVVSSTGH